MHSFLFLLFLFVFIFFLKQRIYFKRPNPDLSTRKGIERVPARAELPAKKLQGKLIVH